MSGRLLVSFYILEVLTMDYNPIKNQSGISRNGWDRRGFSETCRRKVWLLHRYYIRFSGLLYLRNVSNFRWRTQLTYSRLFSVPPPPLIQIVRKLWGFSSKNYQFLKMYHLIPWQICIHLIFKIDPWVLSAVKKFSRTSPPPIIQIFRKLEGFSANIISFRKCFI